MLNVRRGIKDEPFAAAAATWARVVVDAAAAACLHIGILVGDARHGPWKPIGPPAKSPAVFPGDKSTRT
jgi:hypothetical protein